ncbi:hypothetical protein GCM10007927_23770 [Sulfitobacter pacificus]|uniref:Uncharacterized protein n=1 Tax=Sulfitobacter pacificus TaxID=1499314 RepID=A0ABQ5VKL3_9RHOB|nr:hypothetical protein GCM10007927_23770 [Sulfitobacter pacificus]
MLEQRASSGEHVATDLTAEESPNIRILRSEPMAAYAPNDVTQYLHEIPAEILTDTV